MGESRYQWQDLLESAKVALTEAARCPIPEEELPDAIGVANEIRAKAQALVGSLKSEGVEGLRGEIYELKRDGAYERSYNLQGIVRKRMHTDEDMFPADVVFELLEEGVLSSRLQWTKLQKWADKHDVTLTVANHEIEEGDEEAEVGQYWKEKPLKVQPIEETGEVI